MLALLGVVACGGASTDDLFQHGAPAESPSGNKGKSDGGSGAVAPDSGMGSASADAGGNAGATAGNADSGTGSPEADAGADAAGEAAPATPQPGSCAFSCGTLAPDESCYCDSFCKSFGDCCSDFDSVCAGGPQPGPGCTAQLCGTDTPSVSQSGTVCYCDAACVQYGDCCGNVAQVCTP